MGEDLFTTVVAVDANYVRQLEYSVLTWQRFRREIFENPLLLIIDRQTDFATIGGLPQLIAKHPKLTVVVWPDEAHAAAPFLNQRDRMLSAFVHVPPKEVKTRWWMKVDCDAIALGNPNAWYDPAWFASMRERAAADPPPPLSQLSPIMVAPAWHYTKPGHQCGDLDNWGNAHPILCNWPPLNIPFNGEHRLGHKRICSWVSFYQTEWTRYAAALCEYPRIPVPSQDGFHWYIAARTGQAERVLKVNMKNLGWTNVPKFKNLKAKVEELFQTLETR